MKPINAIITICLLFSLVISGCAQATPNVTEVTTLKATTAPATSASAATLKSTVALPTSTITLTPTLVPTKALIVRTLESTTAPPIVFTQQTPASTATPEPTPDEKDFPNSLIQISVPGDLSQLASPIHVQADVLPGDGRLISMQLFGEDERLLSDQLIKLVKSESGWVNLVEDINFEISAAGESALLVLTTRDEFGRRIAQSTSHIILIQIGKSDINKNEFIQQPFVVQSPKIKAEVKGGILYVSGYAHPFNSNPIIIELLTESGGVMETKVVKLPRNPSGLNYLPFITDIPYQVDIPTPVRLTIRQRSEMLPNIDVALSSQLITLNP